ncbi:18 kDa heat shock protein [Enhygromyxa salina]|uniref:18 kDa heat shock protein n=2 Tax=Enhygromyxa salina TaxID=215803 RepID=A0A2S9XBS6_9BACT|nr:18 kDa heat shock protein [Enhygromyxa salina]
MLIHRFNPNDHFRTMDMLFDAIMPNGRRATNFVRKPARLTLADEEQAFILRAELPGLDPEALELSVGDDWIELTAKRETAVPEGYTALRRERGAYELQRRINLPKRIDQGAVEAQLRDGVLRVSLPKHASVQPRQITIKAA